MVIATDNGVRNVPPIFSRAARTMGSKPIHTLVFVMLPASLPFIVSGMKQGWAFAWRSLMAAEIYVTILPGFGLGQLLDNGRDLSAMDQVIGIMIVIIAIGLLADKILFSPMGAFLHHRWGTGPRINDPSIRYASPNGLCTIISILFSAKWPSLRRFRRVFCRCSRRRRPSAALLDRPLRGHSRRNPGRRRKPGSDFPKPSPR